MSCGVDLEERDVEEVVVEGEEEEAEVLVVL